MIDEISRIGEINSVNDFFDFKLSIKTIILLAIAWSVFTTIFVIFMFGGVNNTIDYMMSLMETTKRKIILNKGNKEEKGEKREKESDDSEKT